MMRTLFALLLLAASPAFAAQDDQAPSKEPVAVGAPAPATAGYMTFPMRSGKDKTGGGCLWQLPVTRKDGLEVYAAMSAVRMGPSIESALQIAGSLEKDLLEKYGKQPPKTSQKSATDPSSALGLTAQQEENLLGQLLGGLQ